MRLAALALLLVVNAPLALAQHTVELADGWTSTWPAEPECEDGDGGTRTYSLTREIGCSGLSEAFRVYTSNVGFPFEGAQAAVKLREVADRFVADFVEQSEGGKLVRSDITRCDQGDVVGLELKLSIKHGNGLAIRVHARMFLVFGRLVQAVYAVPRDLYSAQEARKFLGSLRDARRAETTDKPVATRGR